MSRALLLILVIGLTACAPSASPPQPTPLTMPTRTAAPPTPVAAPIPSGRWIELSNMSRDHDGHIAVALPSGQVLIAGGTSDVQPTQNSAKLFEIGTESWSPTGSMLRSREAATGTLLPDGRVLVAGGRLRGRDHLPAAEIYEPGAGRWVPTGSLSSARSYHSATLLPTGEVLVTGGGVGGSTGFASAELYNPTTGQWTATSNMRSGRFLHTATLLPDGAVLITGGLSERTPTASTERYDALTGTWQSTALMNTSRLSHTATLLPDGRVLVAGGTTVRGTSASPTVSAELFDPATGLWAPTGSLNLARVSHTATLLASGRVLVIGGEGINETNYVSLNSAEIYDPTSGRWTPVAPMREARFNHTATRLSNGRVLVAGGVTQTRPLSGSGSISTLHLPSADIFDPEE